MPAASAWVIYAAAALAEIGGCFGVWLWLREGRSAGWAVGGIVALAVFAGLLTRVPTDAAGRAFAAYGGVYIAASVLWMWVVEHQRPGLMDMAGVGLCLLGVVAILSSAPGRA